MRLCRNWLTISVPWYENVLAGATDEKFLKLKERLKKLITAARTNNFEKMLDAGIEHLLENLPEKNSIRPLVKKNENSNLWERLNGGIFIRSEQA